MSTRLDVQLRSPSFKGESLPVSQTGKPRLGLVLGPGQHLVSANGARRFDLCVLDLDDPVFPLTLIPMDFFGHGITPDPNHPERLAVFEKRGKGGCEIDLKSGSVTRNIATKANREFYGHGTYSPDGKLLYCTETVLEGNHAGIVAVRDAETHEELGEFPTFGSSPHDCRLIEEGDVMVITNGGGSLKGVAPSVTYVDVRAEKLLEKLEFDTATINAGHLDITTKGGLAVVSAQREGLPDRHPGGISLRLANDKLNTLKKPRKIVDRLVGETLSVCIHESTNVVGATTPAGNLLTFWDLESGELIRSYDLQNPRGIEITQDGEHFIVSFGFGQPPEALCLFSAATLEKIGGFDLSPTGITGSHLISHSLPPAMRA